MLYAAYVAMNNQDVCGKWCVGYEVHHIDFDYTNDTPSNLMCVTPAEHRLLHSKPIVAYKNGVKVGVFWGQKEAASCLDVNKSYISIYLRTGKPAAKTAVEYTFEYANEETYAKLYNLIVEEIKQKHDNL